MGGMESAALVVPNSHIATGTRTLFFSTANGCRLGNAMPPKPPRYLTLNDLATRCKEVSMMLMKSRRNLALLLVIVLLVAAAYLLIKRGIEVRDSLRAKVTATHMRQMATILRYEKPDSVEPEVLDRLMKKYDKDGYVLDGWRRRIDVKLIATEENVTLYQLTSNGRDGKRGSCCVKFTNDDWDADAVLLDGDWLQIW